jgi:hypothetical protein
MKKHKDHKVLIHFFLCAHCETFVHLVVKLINIFNLLTKLSTPVYFFHFTE